MLEITCPSSLLPLFDPTETRANPFSVLAKIEDGCREGESEEEESSSARNGSVGSPSSPLQ